MITLRIMLPDIDNYIDIANSLVKQYGSYESRNDYKYLVYYDVIDSAGAEAKRKGKDLDGYSEQVYNYQKLINLYLSREIRDARESRSEVFSTRGSEDSFDDSKYIFIRGENSKKIANDIIRTLLNNTAYFEDVFIRLHIVPCSFAGTRAFRMECATEIEGRRFWQHLSRLQKEADKIEITLRGTRGSFYLSAAPCFYSAYSYVRGATASKVKKVEVMSEAEGLYNRVEVVYGKVTIPTQAKNL